MTDHSIVHGTGGYGADRAWDGWAVYHQKRSAPGLPVVATAI